jgi:large subunit ribosomal protein L31
MVGRIVLNPPWLQSVLRVAGTDVRRHITVGRITIKSALGGASGNRPNRPTFFAACHQAAACYLFRPFMKADIHPKYVDAEIRCACGNVIKTRSTKPVIIVGICNVCHPFYTGQQKFVDTAGRVDKFQQRLAKTQAAQAAAATKKKRK